MVPEPKLGEIVAFSIGASDVLGTVIELYGSDPRRQVVLQLTPEVSGDFCYEPTTLSLPVERVHRVDVPA